MTDRLEELAAMSQDQVVGKIHEMFQAEDDKIMEAAAKIRTADDATGMELYTAVLFIYGKGVTAGMKFLGSEIAAAVTTAQQEGTTE